MITLDLKTLRDAVRTQVDKDYTDHVTNFQIDQMLERSWQLLYQQICLANESYYVERRSFSIKRKTNYFPYNMLKIVGVDRYYGNNFLTLKRSNFNERSYNQNSGNYFDYYSSGYDDCFSYTFFGNKLSIYPNNNLGSVDDRFVIYYIPEAPTIASGMARIHNGWEEWLVFDVAIKSNIREESATRDLILQRKLILDKIKEFSESRDYGSPKTMHITDDWGFLNGINGYGLFERSSTSEAESYSFEDLLIPYFNELNQYSEDFLAFFIAKSDYYEFNNNVAYIGFQHKDEASQWCVCKIENRKITYGIYSANTSYPDLVSAWENRLNLVYQDSLNVVSASEGAVASVEAPHILFGWSQANITDVANVNNTTFTRYDAPYGSQTIVPASGLSEAYFLIGVSNEASLSRLLIGGLDQLGAFNELGLSSGYRYYISNNPLLPEFFGNQLISLGVSGQVSSVGSVLPPSEGSIVNLGTVDLKLLWSDTDGYPDIQGDSRVLSYSPDSASKTISGEFHNANDGLKVYRGNNNFWLKDEQVESDGDIISAIYEYDDNSMRTLRSPLVLNGEVVDLDVSPSNELFLLQEAVSGSAGMLYTINETNNSLYTIDKASGASTLVGSLGITSGWRGLAYDGNSLYAIDNNNNLYTVNTITGSATLVGALGSGTFSSLTWSVDSLYTVNLSGVSNSLYTVNKDTGASALVGSLGITGIYSLTWDGTNLYGISGTLNNLYRINRDSGSAVLVGALGVNSAIWECLTWDGANLYAVNNNNDSLYTVNRTTGSATLVGQVGTGDWESLTNIPAPVSEQPKAERYSRYTIPDSGLPTLASETNDANSGTLSRVVGGDDDVLVCREEVIPGGVLYSVNRSSNQLYTIDLSTGTSSRVGTRTYSVLFSSLTQINGTLFSVVYTTGDLYSINPTTGIETLIGNTGVTNAFPSLAQINGVLYSINNSNDSLYSINPTTGVATNLGTISNLPSQTEGLTSIGDTLYLNDQANDNLYSLNPSTRVISLIGQTGVLGSGDWLSLASIGDTLYAIEAGSRSLYSINKDTGVKTLIGSSGSIAGSGQWWSLTSIPNQVHGNLARFYAYNQSDNTRQSSLDFDFSKNTGESVKSMFYTGQYLNIALSDGTNSRTVVYKREASSYVRQSSLDKAFTGVNFDNASFDNKKLFNVSSIVDDMSGGGNNGGNNGGSGGGNNGGGGGGGSNDPNDLLYAISQNDSLYTINKRTGVATSVGEVANASFRSLAYDGTNLFAINRASDDQLYRINPSTGSGTLVGSLKISGSYDCLAWDGSNLYTINNFSTDIRSNNALFRVNKDIGRLSYIGPLGLELSWEGLTYDGSNLYTLGSDSLYTVNKSTGAASLVGSLGSGSYESLAWDGSNLYTIDRNSNSLYTVDKTNGSISLVSSISFDGQWRSLESFRGGA